MDMTHVSLSFRVGKVRVERGWYSQSFVESKYWKLHEQSPQSLNGDIISDGNGGGLMPSIITELIVACDVKINFGQNQSSYQLAKDKVDSSLGFGIGPFVFGGNYSYENTESKSKASFKGKELNSPGCFVIGYKCHIVPKSPNPNPAITKWTDGKG
jgi:hypothetical protein